MNLTASSQVDIRGLRMHTPMPPEIDPDAPPPPASDPDPVPDDDPANTPHSPEGDPPVKPPPVSMKRCRR